jgi:hypothetical protein
MKIRKFNESLDRIDLEYINECFIDIIDMGFQVSVDHMDVYDDYNQLSTDYNTCEVNIEKLIQQKYASEAVSIEKLVSTFERVSEMVNNIEVCIEKVKIKYDVSSTIFYRQMTTSINIEFKKN